MSNSIFQQTIKEPISIKGVGLHTGQLVTMTFHPAPPNHGFKFRRTDLENSPIIDADVDNVVDVSRGTTLEQNGARISTIEHSLAALVGLELDNILIDVDGPEIPILDGSAKPFLDALQGLVVEQEEERHYFELKDNLSYSDKSRKVEMTALPSDSYKITVMIDFDSPVLGSQHASFERIQEFREEIAASRTFCFLHELENLLDANLIKGGDLDNAIVIVDKKMDEAEQEKLRKVFNKQDIYVPSKGILNNVELRHQNEPARHKLLDVVGDLALIGTPIKAKIIASRPGHAANVEFAKKVKDFIKANKQKISIPKYDPNLPPVYDITAIEKFLPHKYPFLLVDKIIELNEKEVVGIKSVTFNEHFFQGHFPGNPVMPGVLQIEALAQTGGLLALNTVEDPHLYDTYFLMIDKVKFKNKVVPGDTLILKMELLSPIRRGICEMKGTAFVGNKISCEATMVAKILKRERQ